MTLLSKIYLFFI